jgi:hypothetical protein
VTNNAELAQRMSMLRSHGITRDPAQMKQSAPPSWHYEQQLLGLNYRITDLQAALGISQLDRLSAFIQRRREIAQRYDEAFAHLDLRPQVVPADSASARHLYIIHTESKRRDALFSQLRAAGIGVNVHYAPVHLQPYYRELGFTEGLCPNAEAHGREAISLPVYADLDASQQDYVITTLVNLLTSQIPPLVSFLVSMSITSRFPFTEPVITPSPYIGNLVFTLAPVNKSSGFSMAFCWRVFHSYKAGLLFSKIVITESPLSFIYSLAVALILSRLIGFLFT